MEFKVRELVTIVHLLKMTDGLGDMWIVLGYRKNFNLVSIGPGERILSRLSRRPGISIIEKI